MNKTINLVMDNFITRGWLENLNFKPFNSFDWMEFSGCESPVPFRAETTIKILGKPFNVSVILDGNTVAVFSPEYEYGDIASCGNINALPY